MSAKIMGQVFDLDLPQSELLVLLAMADHASHDGSGIRPGQILIAWKTGFNLRSVRRIVRRLIAKGILEIVRAGGGRGRATTYRVRIDQAPHKEPLWITPLKDDSPVTVSRDETMTLEALNSDQTVTPRSPQPKPSTRPSPKGASAPEKSDFVQFYVTEAKRLGWSTLVPREWRAVLGRKAAQLAEEISPEHIRQAITRLAEHRWFPGTLTKVVVALEDGGNEKSWAQLCREIEEAWAKK